MSQPASRPVRPATIWGIIIILVLGVFLGIRLVGESLERSNPNEGRPRYLGRVEQAPELIERTGKKASIAALEGAPWIACYVYTTCPKQCMGVLDELKSLAREFPPETGLRFVAFSLQPEVDTPGKLTEWARTHEVDDPRWWFLTTDEPSKIEEFMTGPKSAFKLIEVQRYDPETQADIIAEEGPFAHDARVVLVDQTGHIRGYYNLLDPQSGDLQRDRIVNDIRHVIGEGEEKKGGRSLWWLAALVIVVVVFVALTGGRGRKENGEPA